MSGYPATEGADREQHTERDQENDDRSRCRATRLSALEPAEHGHRYDLRLEREVSRDEHDRAELADGAREREGDAGQNRGQDARKNDALESREATRAQRGGGVLHLAIELEENRLNRSNDERERHEEQREQEAPTREHGVDPDGRLRTIEREQGQAGDDRRQSERQVDEGVHEPLADEAIAHERPGDRGPGDGVHERHDEGEL